MDVFAALANPIRRDILALLRNGDRTAGEIAEHFQLSKPSMSEHFAALRSAGLILAERHGTQIRYSLNLSLLESALLQLMDRVSPATTTEAGPWSSARRKP